MTCDRCGAPAEGRHCRACRRMDALESYYGVPEDHIDGEEGDG